MGFINSFVSLFSTGAWSVLTAIVLLILAFVVAAIVKALVLKLLTRTKLKAVLGKAGNETDIAPFIGKLVYLLVFLLFVPGIFASLGMDSAAAPVLGLLNTIWGYLPNLLAAGIILVVGFMIAKLVRQLLIPVFDKISINKLQEKAGIQPTDDGKLSATLAYLVYVLILIPIVIMALQALNISAISDPAIHMLDLIISFIPNILVAIIILIIGFVIGKFGGQIVSRLIAASGLDAKLTNHAEGKMKKFVLSKAIGIVIQVVVVIFFLVEAFSVLKLQILTDIGAAIIAYMPFALSAVLIMAICFFAGTAAEKVLRKSGNTSFALIAKFVIFCIGGFMALTQLGIANNIVSSAFVLIVAALAVAFAIAFGIGGKDFAAKALKKLENNKTPDSSEKDE